MQAVSKNVFSGDTGRKYAREALENIDRINGLSIGDEQALRNMLTSVNQWMERTGTNGAINVSGPASGITMPFKIQDEETASGAGAESGGFGYNGYAHSFGGLSMQFVLMAAIEWGLSILMERQRGLWRRLRAAPVSRGTLLCGRAASSSIIAFCTLAVCWGFSMLVFHVRVSGSWPGFIGCNAALAVFAASLGLFIAALGRTPETTRGIAIFVILILVMLGGAWAPSFIFPQWLQNCTLMIPTRWAMDGFDAMTWRGMGFHYALAPIAVLLGSAVICSLLALRCFRWEED
jgi:ABC-2 type transport system permease protein